MLLIIFILLLGLIGVSLPAQNSDLYNVIVCVRKASNTTTQVTWRTPQSLKNATCEVSGQNLGTAETPLIISPWFGSSGSYIIAVDDRTVKYKVQVTCLDGDQISYKSEELTFLPGALTNKATCTQDSHQTDASGGVFLCAWQGESNSAYMTAKSSLLWWWPTRPNITTCDIHYLQQNKHENRTRTFANIMANLTVPVTAVEAWATCLDDLHRIHRSQRVKLKQGLSSPQCKFNPVWHGVDHSTAFPTNTPAPPTRFDGFNVSSIGKGLVLAFAVIFIAIGFAVFLYRRYKWFLHRRAQRLLRVEDSHEEEMNSMEEFQRMV